MKRKSSPPAKSPSPPTTPKGLPISAQGCRAPQSRAATLGSAPAAPSNPEGVAAACRGDHAVVAFGGQMIPVLGTVGGTREESIQTARNIERFLAAQNGGRMRAFDRAQANYDALEPENDHNCATDGHEWKRSRSADDATEYRCIHCGERTVE